MSAKYLRLTCVLTFFCHFTTCVLGQTVNQVSNGFQPNQWTNSLVAPKEAKLWANSVATTTNATGHIPSEVNLHHPQATQQRPAQVINPYATASPSPLTVMTGAPAAGPITQVTLPPVDMTPVRVEPLVVSSALPQQLAQQARQAGTTTQQLKPLPPQAAVGRSAYLYGTPAVAPNTMPPVTVGTTSPSPLPIHSVSSTGQQQSQQTLGHSVTAEATQPNFQGPPVIGTPLRVANNAFATAGSNASPFGAEPPIEDLPKPPSRRSLQSHIPQSTPSPTPFPTVGQAVPVENGCCANGQCQVLQSPPCTVYANPPHLQMTPVPAYSNQLFVYPQLTQQISPHDLQACIGNSVNAYCAPQQQTFLKRRPVPGTLCGCRSDDSCRLWSRWGSLIYWLKGYDVPALVTTSPAGTPLPDVGVPGLPTTTTLFGDSSIGESLRTGGRLNLGFWAENDRRVGIEGEFFALGSGDEDDFVSTLGGNRIIARPFFNTDPTVNAPVADVVNMPGVINGFVEVDTSSRIYSGAATARFNVACRCIKRNVQSRFDLLAGYRYFHLGETLGIYELTEPTGGAVGETNEFYDEYRTRNDLHSVEFGINWMRQHNRHYIELLGTVALGEVTRRVDTTGFSNVYIPGVADDVFPGGFYNHPSQQGRTEDSEFAVLPQARAKWGYFISPAMRIFVGYDFLYLSSVVRPNSQIDQSLDPADLLTAGRPPRRLRRNLPDDEAWLQGASFGLLYNF